MECNCTVPEDCTLGNKCIATEIVYRATVNSQNHNIQTTKIYYGMTKNPFKQRISDHQTSFDYIRYNDKTSLSKYIWKLKGQNCNFNVSWDLVTRSRAWRRGSNKCGLCLAEKTVILYEKNPSKMLNSRSELMAKCRHSNAHFYS